MGLLDSWSIYEGGNWLIFNPPPTASWTLREVVQGKGEAQSWINVESYRINVVYKELLETHSTELVQNCMAQNLLT